MKSGLDASKETSLASRLDAQGARASFHRALASASVNVEIDPAFEASVLAWADGLPLALDVAARAISNFGAKAVADAPERTLLGAETSLRRALLRAWDDANERERALLVLLAAWEDVVGPALLAEHVTLEVLEALREKGLSVSEPSARIGEIGLRLVRPMRALVRETAGPDALSEAYAIHASVVARAATELTTQFEIT